MNQSEVQSKFERFVPAEISPKWVFIISIAAIFSAEILSMVVIYNLKWLNYWVMTILDGAIMIVIIYPIIYQLLFRSLLLQMYERKLGEMRFRTVLENLPVGVWVTDQNGRIVHGNLASQQIWVGDGLTGAGHKRETKAWWHDHNQRLEALERTADRAIKDRASTLNEEIEIECFDGVHKIILNSAIPILDEANALQGAVLVNQDITGRRKMEKNLIQTNELLERFFFSIDTLIAYMDRDFNFIRVNDTYARAGGHPPEFFIGQNHFDLYPNEDNQAIFRRVVETCEPYSVFEKPFEYVEFPERGTSYWDWSLQPVRGSDGGVEGVVLSLVDVTERMNAELRLARQNQELRELSQAEHRQRELAESLTQATMVLNMSLELDQVLSSILEQIRKSIPFQGAEIFLVEGELLRVAGFRGFENYAHGMPIMGSSLALGDYPQLQQVCQTHQALNIDQVTEHPGWRATEGRQWVQSYLAVPLHVAEQVIGIICLNSEEPGTYVPGTVRRLTAFAAPAALALRNAQIYEAELVARRAAEILSTAARALTQTLKLDEVINTLLDHICAIVPSDIAGVSLLEGETRLGTRVVRGLGQSEDTDFPADIHLEVDNSPVLQTIIATHHILLIADSDQYPEWEGPAWVKLVHSWLLVPIIAGNRVIGVVGLGKLEVGHFTREHSQWLETLVHQAATAIQNAWLFEQVRDSNERLQSLARKLVEIQENERYHIARELHDEAGQALSSLKLGLGRIEQDHDCPAHLRQQLEGLKEMADNVLDELHRLAIDLRPVALDHLGLLAALEQYARNLNSDQRTVKFKAVGFTGDRLSKDVEIALYRIVQEGTTNILRHAHARDVGILLERAGGKVKLFIEDDGIGFAPDLIDPRERLGLVGMRERAEMCGGSLTIESSPGMGTSIIVEVPDVDSNSDRR